MRNMNSVNEVLLDTSVEIRQYIYHILTNKNRYCVLPRDYWDKVYMWGQMIPRRKYEERKQLQDLIIKENQRLLEAGFDTHPITNDYWKGNWDEYQIYEYEHPRIAFTARVIAHLVKIIVCMFLMLLPYIICGLIEMYV